MSQIGIYRRQKRISAGKTKPMFRYFGIAVL